ncbi:MAG TPA: hypothetical protein VJH69_04250 [Candidatus Paceibacterota bacterium]
MQLKSTKFLIVWNLILTLVVLFLIWMSFALTSEIRRMSSQNISQTTVLCKHIEDISVKAGIVAELPNCQKDIEEVYNFIRK